MNATEFFRQWPQYPTVASVIAAVKRSNEPVLRDGYLGVKFGSPVHSIVDIYMDSLGVPYVHYIVGDMHFYRAEIVDKMTKKMVRGMRRLGIPE